MPTTRKSLLGAQTPPIRTLEEAAAQIWALRAEIDREHRANRTDVAKLEATVADHETRIEALEA